MKHIKGNWIMKKNEVIDEDLIVDGNILGKDGKMFNLTVEGSISARNISARYISARGISARNISARDISALDILAEDISAWDISAWNILTGNISAKSISYYAFCIAYKNITCEKIEGRRGNSFHKCLDGKLRIEK